MSERAPRTALLVTGPVAGGIRTHVSLLRCHLPERGYHVRLAAPPHGPPPLAADPSAGLPAPDAPLPMTDRPLSALTPRVAARLAAAGRRWRPAVVHAHGYKAGAAVLAARAAGLRAPLAVTFHNLWPAGADTIARAVLRMLARRAVLVAVSDAIAESLRAVLTGDGTAVTVIGNGVEIDRFAAVDRAAARAALGLAPQTPVVGFFGRLTREKGPDLALAAVAKMAAGGTEARLLIAGEGPERDRLEREACPEVRFLGERADVPALLAACDVVLIPSRVEGQSVVALEAMAAGRPIVAARAGGLAALVEAAGGCLVPPEDPGAMAAAVRGLLADPSAAAALAARGREYVSRHASAAAMADAVGRLYDRMVEGPP